MASFLSSIVFENDFWSVVDIYDSFEEVFNMMYSTNDLIFYGTSSMLSSIVSR